MEVVKGCGVVYTLGDRAACDVRVTRGRADPFGVVTRGCADPSGLVTRGCADPSTLGDVAPIEGCTLMPSVRFKSVANVCNALRTGSPTDSDGVVDDGVFFRI